MNRHATKLAAVLLCAALVAFPLGCQRRPRRIVIGIAVTQSFHPAVRLAVKEINEQGGINGIPLELAGLDWLVAESYEAQAILEWARRFSETPDLVAVVGHSDSASTLSAAAVYNQNKVPQLVTIATNPAITNIGQWTYRLCLSDASQGPALAEYAVSKRGKKRIALIFVNDDYGRGLAQLFEKRATELGAQIVARVLHRNTLTEEDQKTIAETIASMKKQGEPDLILLLQRMNAAAWTLGKLREAGVKSEILGGDSLAMLEFARTYSAVTDGMIVSQFFFPVQENPRTRRFIEEYQKFAGGTPNYGHAFAYDAIYLLRDALLAGDYSREGIKEYLDKVIADQKKTQGAAGDYILGPDHDARRALYIVRVKNGTQELLDKINVK